MSTNVKLYPPDYTQTTAGVGGGTTTVADALSDVRSQSRTTALKISFNRRDAGQNSALLQNRRINASLHVMPLYQVGRQAQAPPFLGVKGFMGGGRGYQNPASNGFWSVTQRLLYSGESVTPLGVKLSSSKLYSGTVSNAEGGRWCGGWGGPYGLAIVDVDKLTFNDERIQKLGASLPYAAAGIAGGIGNKTNGYLMGGGTDWYIQQQSKRIVRYPFATETPVLIGAQLPNPRLAPHNGASNAYNGYAFGGPLWDLNTPAITPLAKTIDRLVMATETVSPVSSSMVEGHFSHAVMNYSAKAYIAGGGPAWPAPTYSDTISAFTYSGETSAPIAAKLTEPRICIDGMSSSMAGYAMGGDGPNTNWGGSQSIDRLTFANELNSRIGSTLPQPLADQGAVSDYGVGFSN